MKRKILVMMLALAMLVSLFSVVVFADGSAQTECTVKSENIASSATVTTRSPCWVIKDYLGYLVDGDPSTGAGGSHAGEAGGVHRFLDFGEPKNITKVVIYVNYEGENANVSNDNSLSAIRNQDHKFTLVCHPLAESGYNRLFQKEFSTKGVTKVEYTSDNWNNEPVQTIEIWNNDSWNNTYIIYEVEVWCEEGEHAWELEQTITPPKCDEAGEGKYKCECGATKTDVIDATGHITDGVFLTDDVKGTHYTSCIICSGRVDEEEHQFDHDCDTDCNDCGSVRTVVGHEYSADCDTDCDKCGTIRTNAPKAHEYTADCDDTCNVCETKRKAKAEHVYDNACDAFCNTCNLERTPADHEYSAVCDPECNVCKLVRDDAEEHKYTRECDVDCNVCKAVRENATPHKFSNACDTTCNVCGIERTVGNHEYLNGCSDKCRICQAPRTVYGHIYNNKCDFDCNECGAQRVPEPHQYGDWIVLVSAEVGVDGYRVQNCKECGLEQGEKIPALEGTNDKTVKTIVIVSCSVVIGGCFAIGFYSLGVKKWVANAKRKKELELQKAKEEAENEDDEDEE